MRDTSCIPHLLASVGGRASRAERRGSLGDHGLPAHSEDVVVVEISLGTVERDGGSDREDVALERHPRGRKRARAREADKPSHSRELGSYQPRSVLQGLDRPALDAAGKRGGEVGLTLMGGFRDSRRHCRDKRDHDEDLTQTSNVGRESGA